MRSTRESVCVKSISISHEDRNNTMLMIAVIIFLMLGLIGANAFSATINLVPASADLGDLDHVNYYTWGIVQSIPAGEEISSATLTFKDIRNWQTETNQLYVHLLDSARDGVYVGSDNRTGDYFVGQGINLVTYYNLPATAQTLNYAFSADELVVLNTYVADGRFALGFDPDCHFYNNGVSLNLVTSPIVPEPATLIMMVLCASTLIVGRRHFK